MKKRTSNRIKNERNRNVNSNRTSSLYISIGVCMIFFLLVSRLTYIMIYKNKDYKKMAQGQWNSQITVDARRGDIVDRNGAILATSIDVYRVDLDLEAIKSYIDEDEDDEITEDYVIRKLAEASELSIEEVTKKLERKTEDGVEIRNSTLIKGIDKEMADRIKALDIYGVVISINPKRYYPNNNFLAHVLGSVNADNTGLNGIELQYDSELTGISGYKIAEIDGNLKELPYQTVKYTSPIDGKTVQLTVDENIQLIAEKVAEKGYVDNKAKDVSIIVSNPNTGEILAMVNKPDFNPNTPYDDYETFEGENDFEKLQNMFRNDLVSNSFEPGSTFKNITMAAALEEHVVSENDTFYCDGGIKFGSTTIKCWNLSGHGLQTLPEILQNSCNVGFMMLGEKLGSAKLKEYIDKFEFGELTKVDLPGEAEGIIKSVSDMSEMDLATIAFGQTNTVNSIQLIKSFNAIVNGGTLIQPHLMKTISHLEENGTAVIDEVFTPEIKTGVISNETSQTLLNYLERTMNQGTKIGAFMGEDRRVGGKSGTAQVVDIINGGYSSDKYIASVIAVYPIEDPQITIYVKVEEPSTGVYYGGQVATPILKNLLTELFPYMDSEVYKERYTEKTNVVVPELRGKSISEANEILKELNLNLDIEGDSKKITSMVPYPGSLVQEGSNITVNSNSDDDNSRKVVMPNLEGKTLEEATNILNSIGISFEVNGSGKVYNQDIIAGKIIEKNTKVNLDLKE